MWSDMCKVVTPADEWNIGTNTNMGSYNWFLFLMDPGNGFNLISWENCWNQMGLTQFTLFLINSQRWCISFLQWLTSLLLILWNCTSTIYGNCMEFHSYMVLTVGLPSQQTLQSISTRSLESNCDFLLHTTPRHKDKSKTTTSEWKHTFGCSVCINRMIGWTYSQWQNCIQ